METNEKKIQKTGEELFQDYYNLFPKDEDNNSVILTTEWNQEGDNFLKFSLYDTNYSPVSISSSTSFICDL